MGHEELLPDANAMLTDEEAILEAERCLNCGGPGALPPCMAACPTGIDVPRFIGEIRDQRPLDAAATVFSSNALGATCARVCPADTFCERVCVLQQTGDGPVRIAALHRYATEAWLDERQSILQSAVRFPLSEVNHRRMAKPGRRDDQLTELGPQRPRNTERSRVSVAVIGAGPAGLSCAAELARLGHRVTIYEKRSFAGGLVTTAIAPYKQCYEPIPQEVNAITALGVDIRFDERIDANRFRTIELEHNAVFLGIGLGQDWFPDLPGEDLKDVWISLAFIERVKRGLVADLSNRRVIVVGCGANAIEVARTAVILGAEDVLVVCPCTEENLSAPPSEILAARREGVRFLFQLIPVRFRGKWKVRAVECARIQPPMDARESGQVSISVQGAPIQSETRSGVTTQAPASSPAVAVPGSEFLVEADLVVNATGQLPKSSLLEDFGIEHRNGYVIVDHNLRTSNPRCFAGGDCVNGGATVAEAVQHGRRAAFAIHAQFTGDDVKPPMGGRNTADAESRGRWRADELRDVPVGVDRINGTIRHYQGDHAILIKQDACKGCPECIRNCPTGSLELDETGRIRMTDIGSCIFCGLCEQSCREGAIRMERPCEALR